MTEKQKARVVKRNDRNMRKYARKYARLFYLDFMTMLDSIMFIIDGATATNEIAEKAAKAIDEGLIKSRYVELYQEVGIFFTENQLRLMKVERKSALPKLEVKVENMTELESLDFEFLWAKTFENYALIQVGSRITSVTSTSRQWAIKIIQDVIIQAQVEGLSEVETIKLLEKQVPKLWKDASKWRAQRIARTESFTASSYASDQAAKSTGLDYVKEWNAALDQRTRPAHFQAHGQKTGKEQKFLVGGQMLEYPRAPNATAANSVNCRCQTLYIRPTQ